MFVRDAAEGRRKEREKVGDKKKKKEMHEYNWSGEEPIG